jgi:rod shape-determining protein MreD
MRDLIEVFFGVLIAFVLFYFVSKVSFNLAQTINFFSLVVIYFAIQKGEIFGAGVGAFCGLVQDSFSIGVIGIAGIAKTIMGFTAGYISKRVNLMTFGKNFIFLLLLIIIELMLWVLLSLLVYSKNWIAGKELILFQPVVTAGFGSILLAIANKIKKVGSSID